MAKSKLKTRKSISSRVTMTNGGLKKKKKGKFRLRKAGKGHFNARTNGTKTQAKRNDRDPSESIQENIANAINA